MENVMSIAQGITQGQLIAGLMVILVVVAVVIIVVYKRALSSVEEE